MLIENLTAGDSYELWLEHKGGGGSIDGYFWAAFVKVTSAPQN